MPEFNPEPLILSARSSLSRLSDLLGRLDGAEYRQPRKILSGSSLGQHVRHVLEFYRLFLDAVPAGVLCYDERNRDPRLEQEPDFARFYLNRLTEDLEHLDLQRPLELRTGQEAGVPVSRILSSVSRELMYCIEHAVHHMAMIRIGLKEAQREDLVSADFGVADATLRNGEQPCVR